ncbi:MAG: hypothetical protein ACYDG2_14545 [Ruminiclostridium sp.]
MGTNFERPDFKRMIHDVERGLINMRRAINMVGVKKLIEAM